MALCYTCKVITRKHRDHRRVLASWPAMGYVLCLEFHVRIFFWMTRRSKLIYRRWKWKPKNGTRYLGTKILACFGIPRYAQSLHPKISGKKNPKTAWISPSPVTWLVVELVWRWRWLLIFFRFLNFLIGEQHYYDHHEAFGPSGTTALYLERDLKKKKLCTSRGITLVSIPFWYGPFPFSFFFFSFFALSFLLLLFPSSFSFLHPFPLLHHLSFHC